MNRRAFLQHTAGATFLPLLPLADMATAANTATDKTTNITTGVATVVETDIVKAASSNRRVILLELAGANDGLNTVVPWSNDHYHKLRPTIGLRKQSIITLDEHFAFNQSLQPAMPLWESNELAVVHGLGYPMPNRSHFKSIALWETGGDGNRAGNRGWATHDIEHAYASSEVDAHGIVLGGSMGIFSNSEGNWLSMSAVNQFADKQLQVPGGDSIRSDGKRSNGKHSSTSVKNPMLEMLLDRAHTLQTSLDRISRKVAGHPHNTRIRGNSKLARQLTHAVNLINAGIDAPVFKVSHSGFDTHENQPARHKKLLNQLALSLRDLRAELIKTDQWRNTIVLTYSEFGRRVAENQSRGTDHGTASAHLITGGAINGGFYGMPPDLANLQDGDLLHTMDYRAVYNRLLSDWLQLPNDRFSSYRDPRLDQIVS